MRHESRLYGWRGRLAAMVVAGALAGCWLSAGAEPPGPDQLREKAGQLERQAQDAKAAGQHDKAQRAMREVKELLAQADRLERAERPDVPVGESRRPALKEKRERLLGELKELRAAGKEAEAAEVKERIVQLERGLKPTSGEPRTKVEPGLRPRIRERLQARVGPGWGPPGRAEAGPRLGFRGPPLGPQFEGRSSPRPEMIERRLRHVEAAIENLRAAGMPEAAERLVVMADRMRGALAASPRPRLGEPGRFRGGWGPPPLRGGGPPLRR